MILTHVIIEDIKKRLKAYDTIKPKMDELKFVEAIMTDYKIDRKEALKVIQHVRRLGLK